MFGLHIPLLCRTRPPENLSLDFSLSRKYIKKLSLYFRLAATVDSAVCGLVKMLIRLRMVENTDYLLNFVFLFLKLLKFTLLYVIIIMAVYGLIQKRRFFCVFGAADICRLSARFLLSRVCKSPCNLHFASRFSGIA